MDRVLLALLSGTGQGLVGMLISSASVAIIFTNLAGWLSLSPSPFSPRASFRLPLRFRHAPRAARKHGRLRQNAARTRYSYGYSRSNFLFEMVCGCLFVFFKTRILDAF